MGEQRQHYNEDFKQRTVRFIQQQTKTVADIGQELNIPAGTLHQWVAKYRKFESEPLASAEKVRQLEQILKEKEFELKEKDLQIADIEEELAIVKKTVHIFSKPSN